MQQHAMAINAVNARALFIRCRQFMARSSRNEAVVGSTQGGDLIVPEAATPGNEKRAKGRAANPPPFQGGAGGRVERFECFIHRYYVATKTIRSHYITCTLHPSPNLSPEGR